MHIDYYSILNLKRHCTKDDIQKAFGKLISTYSIFYQVKNINLIILCEAYEVLSDSLCRAVYDKYGKEGIKKGVKSDKITIDPWIYHGDVIKTYSEYCVLTNPISCLFIKSNGSLLIDLKKKECCSEILKFPLKLTLNEIFYGLIKFVSVEKKLTHTGDSKSNQTQIVKVKVPRGFPTGGILKSEISNVNTILEPNQPSYMFTTEDIPHKDYKRDNMNLIMIKNVSLKQALFGIKINIKTLCHKVIRVNITQVITPDYVKIINNEGMPNMYNLTQYGAIIIKFNITYPLFMPITNETCESFNENQINV
ncbi:Chaperone DnaJ, C-terminal,DnaJ domain,HSP40/DnaJ peptide-binding [Cinara cedri]|uniref:Chaperone DnaJ, C-terminal,DnaJ domain,HSP40/DnaJ peptide-binding n=1 Tax=Cinara cedri TaxID=506608 RepID=A0A5E4NDH6_9HEMI|nr:Chaperone DnaJ, C-terminal,DnaJ domain,HSP40/DnaJ peptide-binding [Cinara cedri]